jgi:hypothetical protein
LTDDATKDGVTQALWVARMRAWRTALLGLHKVLLDSERRRYEQDRGRIQGPQHALQLAMHDPWFAWLRPLSELIVQLDERLAEPLPFQPGEVQNYAEQVRRLLQLDLGGPDFVREYRRSLQDLPDAVVAHGKVLGLLNSE